MIQSPTTSIRQRRELFASAELIDICVRDRPELKSHHRTSNPQEMTKSDKETLDTQDWLFKFVLIAYLKKL